MEKLKNDHVLVVDDDDDILNMMVEYLHSLGCAHVHIAKNGSRALAVLDRNDVEVIFTDLNMPAMDGIEFVEQLSERKYRGGLCVMSSHGHGVLRAVSKITENRGLKCLDTIRKNCLSYEKVAACLEQNTRVAAPVRLGMKTKVRVDELERGIEKNEFFFVAQPKVAVQSGKWSGVELLIRWQHPQKGELSPGLFIDSIVESNLLSRFNQWVSRESLKVAHKITKQHPHVNVAINFSTPCFDDKQFYEELLLQAYTLDIPVNKITLELTERHPFDSGFALEALTKLRLRGFNLAIDDYGIGFSNLEKLYQGPFSELKMDMSFLHMALKEKNVRKVLGHCIDIAHDMGMLATAEGVGDEESWALVRELGFDCAQGFYIGKPTAVESLSEWAGRWSNETVAIA